MAVLSVGSSDPNILFTITHNGGTTAVTKAEAEQWLSQGANKNKTNAEIEAQLQTMFQSRKLGLTERVYIKIINRSPINVAILVGPDDPKWQPPADWWVATTVTNTLPEF